MLRGEGEEIVFGSIASGGRYDDLVARFTGQRVPAAGISIGVSRLLSALRGQQASLPPLIVVTVFDKTDAAASFAMAQELRAAGLRAEAYVGNGKMGDQFKYADKRNSPCVIIQGSDEKANGKVQIKDLILGAGLAEIRDREEYLKKQTEAQYEVDESRIVEAVREVLARHNVKWG